ncbi:MAG: hypothetical protein FWH03_00495 [Firmicutes bacterium]|nr:hypothetical protein [Bacillota bacterium]
MVQHSKASEIIDGILLFLVTAFFGIAFAGYFSRSTYVILAAGITAALAVTALVRLFRKRGAPLIKKRDYDEMWLHFFLSGETYCLEYMYNALHTRYAAEQREGYLLVNKTAVFVHFKPEVFSFAQLCAIFARMRTEGIKRIAVLTAAGADREAKRTAALLPESKFFIADGEQVYRILRRLDALPKIEIKLKSARLGFKEFLTRAVAPAAAKRYLFTALFLIGSSFIMPNSVYFIVVAAICIVLTVLAKIDIAKRLGNRRV